MYKHILMTFEMPKKLQLKVVDYCIDNRWVNKVFCPTDKHILWGLEWTLKGQSLTALPTLHPAILLIYFNIMYSFYHILLLVALLKSPEKYVYRSVLNIINVWTWACDI